MKRFCIIAMAALASIAAQAQDGWKHPKTIAATIVERFADQPDRKVEVALQNDAISYKTSAAIDGLLGGTPRIESVGPSGVMTWIEGKPEVALPLYAPTTYGVDEFLDRPGFSRADLEFNLQGIEKALDKKVLVGKSETVAGRDCLVLKVPDSADRAGTDYQQLWIDRETGITMRQRDFFGGKMTYERTIEKIDFSLPNGSVLAPKPDAKILRGLVSPITLSRFSSLADPSAFSADISKVNEASKQAWAGSFDLPGGFRYSQTIASQVRSQEVALGGIKNNQQRAIEERNAARQRAAQQRRENRLRNREFRAQRTAVVQTTEGINDGPAISMTFTTSDADGGTLQIFQVDNSENEGAGPNANGNGGSSNKPKAKLYPFAQSDFVNPATGDTISVLQIEGQEIEPYIDELVLGTPKTNVDSRIANSKLYTVGGPGNIKVLTWTSGQSRHAIVATNMSEAQMIEMASKLKTN